MGGRIRRSRSYQIGISSGVKIKAVRNKVIYTNNEDNKETALIPESMTLSSLKEMKLNVAYCSELDTSSCGNTVENVRKQLKDAESAFLKKRKRRERLKISSKNQDLNKMRAEEDFCQNLSQLS